jgi:hypothetical protein
MPPRRFRFDAPQLDSIARALGARPPDRRTACRGVAGRQDSGLSASCRFSFAFLRPEHLEEATAGADLLRVAGVQALPIARRTREMVKKRREL